MIDIGSRTGHKLGILLILTTLTIGSVSAALTWENPDGSYVGSGTLTMNVSNDSSTDSWMTFYYKENSGSWTYDSDNDTTSNDNYWTSDIGLSQFGDGDTLELKANNTQNSQTTTVDVDQADPGSFELSQPGDYASTSDPTVEVTASDDVSGIKNLSIDIDDSDGNDVNSKDCTSSSCSIDLSGLSDGTFDVSATAYDNVGRSSSTSSLSFTVDTSYDGDDNPSFSVEGGSDGVVKFDEDKDLTVDFGNTDSTSDVTVTCYVGGESVGSFTVSSDNPDNKTCTIDHDQDAAYYGTSADIYLKMEDEAGNTAESDTQTVDFDVEAPSVSSLEIPYSAELYNSNFDVEFTASDDASGIEEVEYYFDSSTSEGGGTDIGWSSDQTRYEIDTSNLSKGDHTLYVRAKDKAGRWGSSASVDFSFDPNAKPEVSLTVPDNISVTAGQETEFDVTIENTGNLHISSIKLSNSVPDITSDSVTISDIEPGETVTKSLGVNTDAQNIGTHTMSVSTNKPSLTKEVNLVVRANSNQQQEIDSQLSKYQSNLDDLESNVTELKQKVSESKKQRLESNFSAFKQKVEDAQEAVDNGNYYRAESILEGIDKTYSAAETSYQTVQKEYKQSQFRMLLMLGIGGLLVLGGGALGFVSYSDRFDFEVDVEKLKEIELDTESLEELPEKIKGLFDREPEADDFEWDGFKNN